MPKWFKKLGLAGKLTALIVIGVACYGLFEYPIDTADGAKTVIAILRDGAERVIIFVTDVFS